MTNVGVCNVVYVITGGTRVIRLLRFFTTTLIIKVLERPSAREFDSLFKSRSTAPLRRGHASITKVHGFMTWLPNFVL